MDTGVWWNALFIPTRWVGKRLGSSRASYLCQGLEKDIPDTHAGPAYVLLCLTGPFLLVNPMSTKTIWHFYQLSGNLPKRTRTRREIRRT